MNTTADSKQYWVDDRYATRCFACSSRFSMLRRKHHCRQCGQIFCADCLVVTSRTDKSCKSCDLQRKRAESSRGASGAVGGGALGGVGGLLGGGSESAMSTPMRAAARATSDSLGGGTTYSTTASQQNTDMLNNYLGGNDATSSSNNNNSHHGSFIMGGAGAIMGTMRNIFSHATGGGGTAATANARCDTPPSSGISNSNTTTGSFQQHRGVSFAPPSSSAAKTAPATKKAPTAAKASAPAAASPAMTLEEMAMEGYEYFATDSEDGEGGSDTSSYKYNAYSSGGEGGVGGGGGNTSDYNDAFIDDLVEQDMAAYTAQQAAKEAAKQQRIQAHLKDIERQFVTNSNGSMGSMPSSPPRAGAYDSPSSSKGINSNNLVGILGGSPAADRNAAAATNTAVSPSNNARNTSMSSTAAVVGGGVLSPASPLNMSRLTNNNNNASATTAGGVGGDSLSAAAAANQNVNNNSRSYVPSLASPRYNEPLKSSRRRAGGGAGGVGADNLASTYNSGVTPRTSRTTMHFLSPMQRDGGGGGGSSNNLLKGMASSPDSLSNTLNTSRGGGSMTSRRRAGYLVDSEGRLDLSRVPPHEESLNDLEYVTYGTHEVPIPSTRNPMSIYLEKVSIEAANSLQRKKAQQVAMLRQAVPKKRFYTALPFVTFRLYETSPDAKFFPTSFPSDSMEVDVSVKRALDDRYDNLVNMCLTQEERRRVLVEAGELEDEDESGNTQIYFDGTRNEIVPRQNAASIAKNSSANLTNTNNSKSSNATSHLHLNSNSYNSNVNTGGGNNTTHTNNTNNKSFGGGNNNNNASSKTSGNSRIPIKGIAASIVPPERRMDVLMESLQKRCSTHLRLRVHQMLDEVITSDPDVFDPLPPPTLASLLKGVPPLNPSSSVAAPPPPPPPSSSCSSSPQLPSCSTSANNCAHHLSCPPAEIWEEAICDLAWKVVGQTQFIPRYMLPTHYFRGAQSDEALDHSGWRQHVAIIPAAGGDLADTEVIQGVALWQPLSEKIPDNKLRASMPRVLLLGGAAVGTTPSLAKMEGGLEEYVASYQGWFEKLYDRVRVWNPTVILCEGSMHHYILERAANDGIKVATLIKRPLLERLERALGAKIIEDLAKVTIGELQECARNPHLSPVGRATEMTVEFINEQPLLVFSGLHRPTFSTVLLRGAHVKALNTVTSLLEQAIECAYHLTAVAHFCADFGIVIGPKSELWRLTQSNLPVNEQDFRTFVDPIDAALVAGANKNAESVAASRRGSNQQEANNTVNKSGSPPQIPTISIPRAHHDGPPSVVDTDDDALNNTINSVTNSSTQPSLNITATMALIQRKPSMSMIRAKSVLTNNTIERGVDTTNGGVGATNTLIACNNNNSSLSSPPLSVVSPPCEYGGAATIPSINVTLPPSATAAGANSNTMAAAALDNSFVADGAVEKALTIFSGPNVKLELSFKATKDRSRNKKKTGADGQLVVPSASPLDSAAAYLAPIGTGGYSRTVGTAVVSMNIGVHFPDSVLEAAAALNVANKNLIRDNIVVNVVTLERLGAPIDFEKFIEGAFPASDRNGLAGAAGLGGGGGGGALRAAGAGRGGFSSSNAGGGSSNASTANGGGKLINVPFQTSPIFADPNSNNATLHGIPAVTQREHLFDDKEFYNPEAVRDAKQDRASYTFYSSQGGDETLLEVLQEAATSVANYTKLFLHEKRRIVMRVMHEAVSPLERDLTKETFFTPCCYYSCNACERLIRQANKGMLHSDEEEYSMYRFCKSVSDKRQVSNHTLHMSVGALLELMFYANPPPPKHHHNHNHHDAHNGNNQSGGSAADYFNGLFAGFGPNNDGTGNVSAAAGGDSINAFYGVPNGQDGGSTSNAYSGPPDGIYSLHCGHEMFTEIRPCFEIVAPHRRSAALVSFAVESIDVNVLIGPSMFMTRDYRFQRQAAAAFIREAKRRLRATRRLEERKAKQLLTITANKHGRDQQPKASVRVTEVIDDADVDAEKSRKKSGDDELLIHVASTTSTAAPAAAGDDGAAEGHSSTNSGTDSSDSSSSNSDSSSSTSSDDDDESPNVSTSTAGANTLRQQAKLEALLGTGAGGIPSASPSPARPDGTITSMIDFVRTNVNSGLDGIANGFKKAHYHHSSGNHLAKINADRLRRRAEKKARQQSITDAFWEELGATALDLDALGLVPKYLTDHGFATSDDAADFSAMGFAIGDHNVVSSRNDSVDGMSVYSGGGMLSRSASPNFGASPSSPLSGTSLAARHTESALHVLKRRLLSKSAKEALALHTTLEVRGFDTSAALGLKSRCHRHVIRSHYLTLERRELIQNVMEIIQMMSALNHLSFYIVLPIWGSTSHQNLSRSSAYNTSSAQQAMMMVMTGTSANGPSSAPFHAFKEVASGGAHSSVSSLSNTIILINPTKLLQMAHDLQNLDQAAAFRRQILGPCVQELVHCFHNSIMLTENRNVMATLFPHLQPNHNSGNHNNNNNDVSASGFSVSATPATATERFNNHYPPRDNTFGGAIASSSRNVPNPSASTATPPASSSLAPSVAATITPAVSANHSMIQAPRGSISVGVGGNGMGSPSHSSPSHQHHHQHNAGGNSPTTTHSGSNPGTGNAVPSTNSIHGAVAGLPPTMNPSASVSPSVSVARFTAVGTCVGDSQHIAVASAGGTPQTNIGLGLVPPTPTTGGPSPLTLSSGGGGGSLFPSATPAFASEQTAHSQPHRRSSSLFFGGAADINGNAPTPYSHRRTTTLDMSAVTPPIAPLHHHRQSTTMTGGGASVSATTTQPQQNNLPPRSQPFAVVHPAARGQSTTLGVDASSNNNANGGNAPAAASELTLSSLSHLTNIALGQLRSNDVAYSPTHDCYVRWKEPTSLILLALRAAAPHMASSHTFGLMDAKPLMGLMSGAGSSNNLLSAGGAKANSFSSPLPEDNAAIAVGADTSAATAAAEFGGALTRQDEAQQQSSPSPATSARRSPSPALASSAAAGNNASYSSGTLTNSNGPLAPMSTAVGGGGQSTTSAVSSAASPLVGYDAAHNATMTCASASGAAFGVSNNSFGIVGVSGGDLHAALVTSPSMNMSHAALRQTANRLVGIDSDSEEFESDGSSSSSTTASGGDHRSHAEASTAEQGEAGGVGRKKSHHHHHSHHHRGNLTARGGNLTARGHHHRSTDNLVVDGMVHSSGGSSSSASSHSSTQSEDENVMRDVFSDSSSGGEFDKVTRGRFDQKGGGGGAAGQKQMRKTKKDAVASDNNNNKANRLSRTVEGGILKKKSAQDSSEVSSSKKKSGAKKSAKSGSTAEDNTLTATASAFARSKTRSFMQRSASNANFNDAVSGALKQSRSLTRLPLGDDGSPSPSAKPTTSKTVTISLPSPSGGNIHAASQSAEAPLSANNNNSNTKDNIVVGDSLSIPSSSAAAQHQQQQKSIGSGAPDSGSGTNSGAVTPTPSNLTTATSSSSAAAATANRPMPPSIMASDATTPTFPAGGGRGGAAGSVFPSSSTTTTANTTRTNFTTTSSNTTMNNASTTNKNASFAYVNNNTNSSRFTQEEQVNHTQYLQRNSTFIRDYQEAIDILHGVSTRGKNVTNFTDLITINEDGGLKDLVAHAKTLQKTLVTASMNAVNANAAASVQNNGGGLNSMRAGAGNVLINNPAATAAAGVGNAVVGGVTAVGDVLQSVAMAPIRLIANTTASAINRAGGGGNGATAAKEQAEAEAAALAMELSVMTNAGDMLATDLDEDLLQATIRVPADSTTDGRDGAEDGDEKKANGNRNHDDDNSPNSEKQQPIDAVTPPNRSRATSAGSDGSQNNNNKVSRTASNGPLRVHATGNAAVHSNNAAHDFNAAVSGAASPVAHSPKAVSFSSPTAAAASGTATTATTTTTIWEGMNDDSPTAASVSMARSKTAGAVAGTTANSSPAMTENTAASPSPGSANQPSAAAAAMEVPLPSSVQEVRMGSAFISTTTQRLVSVQAMFPLQFAAMRYLYSDGCPEDIFVSLLRCEDFHPGSGQSHASGKAFFKTSDQRYILKQVKRIEAQHLMDIAPEYFSHMAQMFTEQHHVATENYSWPSGNNGSNGNDANSTAGGSGGAASAFAAPPAAASTEKINASSIPARHTIQSLIVKVLGLYAITVSVPKPKRRHRRDGDDDDEEGGGASRHHRRHGTDGSSGVSSERGHAGESYRGSGAAGASTSVSGGGGPSASSNGTAAGVGGAGGVNSGPTSANGSPNSPNNDDYRSNRVKDPDATGEVRYFILMENLLMSSKTQVQRVFDLKGSQIRRFAEESPRATFMDENLINRTRAGFFFYVTEDDSSWLKTVFQRDTEFLARSNVMDYSLIAGMERSLDEPRYMISDASLAALRAARGEYSKPTLTVLPRRDVALAATRKKRMQERQERDQILSQIRQLQMQQQNRLNGRNGGSGVNTKGIVVDSLSNAAHFASAAVGEAAAARAMSTGHSQFGGSNAAVSRSPSAQAYSTPFAINGAGGLVESDFSGGEGGGNIASASSYSSAVAGGFVAPSHLRTSAPQSPLARQGTRSQHHHHHRSRSNAFGGGNNAANRLTPAASALLSAVIANSTHASKAGSPVGGVVDSSTATQNQQQQSAAAMNSRINNTTAAVSPQRGNGNGVLVANPSHSASAVQFIDDLPSHGLLHLGIIDYLHPYSWSKKSEQKLKEMKNFLFLKLGNRTLGEDYKQPTIIEPYPYKQRFERFMGQYFCCVPTKMSMMRKNYEGAMRKQRQLAEQHRIRLILQEYEEKEKEKQERMAELVRQQQQEVEEDRRMNGGGAGDDADNDDDAQQARRYTGGRSSLLSRKRALTLAGGGGNKAGEEDAPGRRSTRASLLGTSPSASPLKRGSNLTPPPQPLAAVGNSTNDTDDAPSSDNNNPNSFFKVSRSMLHEDSLTASTPYFAQERSRGATLIGGTTTNDNDTAQQNMASSSSHLLDVPNAPSSNRSSFVNVETSPMFVDSVTTKEDDDVEEDGEEADEDEATPSN